MEFMRMEPHTLEHLAQWIGKSESVDDVVTAAPMRALSATLDYPDCLLNKGAFLPELWHWLYFLPHARQSEIGPDGHPRRGGFMPPIPLPRRMWAGSRLHWLTPLRLGQAITRASTIESITHKTGHSGGLLFVLVKHVISNPDGVALIEEHDIVYRCAPNPDEKPINPTPAPTNAKWFKAITPDAVLLFRYSALTFNGHRIHYDHPYATEVEAYPGLVVHGPLLATLLVDLVRQSIPGCTLSHFEFRAIRPTYDTHPFQIGAKPDLERDPSGKTIAVWAQDYEGWLTMQATAVLA